MLPLGFASFFVFGIGLVLLGANQDDLARALDLDLAGSGLLASSLALGLGVGIVGAGPLVDRYPRRPLFAASTLLAAAALLTVGADMGFARACVHVALTGLGMGVYDTLVSALVVERFHERSAKPMSLVHAGATLSAMLAPPAIGWIAAYASWTASFHAAGVGHLVLTAAVLVVPVPGPPRPEEGAEYPPLRTVLSREMLPFAVVAFAYVGVETSLGIFAVPYATDALHLGADRGRTAISAVWLGLLVGRLGLLALPGRVGATALLAAGLLGAVFLGAGVAAGFSWIELHYAATGLALGFVFPLLIALAGQRFPHARGTAAGVAGGAGALGGFAIPWLHGALGDQAGAAVAVGSLVGWTLLIAAAAQLARRHADRERKGPPTPRVRRGASSG